MAQLATEIIITLIRIPLCSLQMIGHFVPLEQNCHAGGIVKRLWQMSSHGSTLSFLLTDFYNFSDLVMLLAWF